MMRTLSRRFCSAGPLLENYFVTFVPFCGMKIGDTLSWRRTFTEEDIRLFTTISGDGGEHHLVPDAKGRLMAHGLLTATLPTKIGGDINLIAREMCFRFHR